MDDHRSVRARVRAAVHFAAAVLFLVTVGGLEAVSIGAWSLRLGMAGHVAGAIGIVWAINLYNFMDGIDGIAGGEAVVVAAAGAGIFLWRGALGAGLLCTVIALSSAGFLLWNWAPAKIFMGDVGSGFLGFCFAALAIHGEKTGELPLLGWILLLGVFVFDATATLVRRIARRERFYLPHKSHGYQRAVASGFRHAQVAGFVIGVDVALAGLTLCMIADGGWALLAFAAGILVLGSAYLWVERRAPMSGP